LIDSKLLENEFSHTNLCLRFSVCGLQKGMVLIMKFTRILTDTLQTGIGAVPVDVLLGIFLVFAVLVLIMLFVIFFRLLPLRSERKDNEFEKQKQTSPTADHVFSKVTEREERERIRDSELVAVITAAICASLGGNISPDELVVRSIRRVNRQR
jgi:hypothetical protein